MLDKTTISHATVIKQCVTGSDAFIRYSLINRERT